MNNKLLEKEEKLKAYLSQFNQLGIAFSSGVDSSYLLHIAHQELKNKLWAFTIDTAYIPNREIEEAQLYTKQHNINHKIIQLPLMDIIKHNPADRCYFCKTFIFKTITEVASGMDIKNIAEGTNFDDTKTHRPGLKALSELKIHSPLKELGFTKEDIRKLSQEHQLPTWNKPAYACLLTRLPYGNYVTDKELEMVEQSENYIISLGFNGVRVRSHQNLARIEVLPKHMDKVLDKDILKNISEKLKEFGYQFVTLDTCGYISGSFDKID